MKDHVAMEDEMDKPMSATTEQPAPQPTEYTCPMHPEVKQQGPGRCPKCNMALEPRKTAQSANG